MKPRARVRCSRILQRKMKKCEGFVFAFKYKPYKKRRNLVKTIDFFVKMYYNIKIGIYVYFKVTKGNGYEG